MQIKETFQVHGLKKLWILSKMLMNPEICRTNKRLLWNLRDVLTYGKLTRIGDYIALNSNFPHFPSLAFNRFIRNFNMIAKEKPVLMTCNIAITNACHYKCWRCSAKYRSSEGIMSLQETQKAIKGVQDVGAVTIGLTGGEPLLRKDLPEIIASNDQRSTIHLYSTGDTLTIEKAKELKSAGLFGLSISFDHYLPEAHNELRGKSDAFKTAVEAVRISKEVGFYTFVLITPPLEIMKSGKLWTFMDKMAELGVHEIRVGEPAPTGEILNDKKNVYYGHYRELFKDIHIKGNKKKNYPAVVSYPYLESTEQFGCGAGYHYSYIDASGNICPCDLVPLSFGNIKDMDFTLVWKRLNETFNKPLLKCFSVSIQEDVSKKFKCTLPLGYEESLKICSHCIPDDKDLPHLYKKIRDVNYSQKPFVMFTI